MAGAWRTLRLEVGLAAVACVAQYQPSYEETVTQAFWFFSGGNEVSPSSAFWKPSCHLVRSQDNACALALSSGPKTPWKLTLLHIPRLGKWEPELPVPASPGILLGPLGQPLQELRAPNCHLCSTYQEAKYDTVANILQNF
ncbi:Hypothetical predicted protein [Lynx pardinus]|uniref:Uncharacterized protein n=1 Tax=Lynx pardinus TaxID=191816 RepID=A0A485MAN1_LYNPA|nr:Hypothetical predicted protein [Lynx pardinus]